MSPSPHAPPIASASDDNLDVYAHARLYDIAFSYRPFDDEVEAMLRWATAALSRSPTSALELCAGPADHAIASARRGLRSVALDMSAPMCAYAQEKAKRAGVEISVVEGDMRAFSLAAPVELAFTMLNSISHLHSLEDVVAHFGAMRDAVVDGGVYVLEVQHPKDFVGRGARPTGVSSTRTCAIDGTTVETTWGSSDGPYDPLRQVFSAHITLKVNDDDGERTHHEVVHMRDWTFDELRAAAQLAGGWSLIGQHGAFDDVTAVDASDDSWRMILVFQRR